MPAGDRSSAKILLVILAAAALYLLGNGSVALWDRDEPRYAMASRWMARTGDWVVPRVGWGDNPSEFRTAKPALIYWCQATAMKVLGPTVFAARLPSALAMTLTLVLLALVIRRYVDSRHALWTVLILGSSAIVIATAKMCVTDAVLLLWITASQLCLIAIYSGNRSPLVATAMWLAIALGGLTKGPVSLGVPFTTMIVLAILDKRAGVPWSQAIGWWRRTRPLMGLLIVLMITGPWLYLIYHRAPGFLHRIIGHDVIERARTGLEGHSAPPGFYLLTIFGTFFPWSLLLPMGVIIAWRNRQRPDVRFALAAVIGPWIMMELISTKLVHYVLPIFPPLAFIVADSAIQCFDRKYNDLTNRVASIGGLAWTLIFAGLASLPWLATGKFDNVPTGAMIALSAIGIVGGLTVYLAFARQRPVMALSAMGASFVLYCAVLFGAFFPSAHYLRLSPRIAAVLPSDQPVRMLGYKEQSLAFYHAGPIDEAGDNYLQKTPPESWPAFIVLTSDLFDALPTETRSRLRVVSEFSGINYAKSPKPIRVIVLRKE